MFENIVNVYFNWLKIYLIKTTNLFFIRYNFIIYRNKYNIILRVFNKFNVIQTLIFLEICITCFILF